MGVGLARSPSSTCLTGTEVGWEQEDLLKGPLDALSRGSQGLFLPMYSFGSGDSMCLSWTRAAQLSAFEKSQHLKH